MHALRSAFAFLFSLAVTAGSHRAALADPPAPVKLGAQPELAAQPQVAPKTIGPTATDVATRVQSFYNKTKTYQADFKQEYLIKMHNQKKTSDGRVVFEKPGKMSFTYSQPNGNRVVSDGKTLKVYEKENQQMFEQAVDKSQYPAALAFLMGEGDLQKSFTFRLLDAGAMQFENGYVLEGKPVEATPAYKLILLYVDAATAQVRRVLILDAQGNRNRFDFSNPIVNKPPPPGEFILSPPPNTQIVRP
jgi:outer membrane lipoprotein carrier protein